MTHPSRELHELLNHPLLHIVPRLVENNPLQVVFPLGATIAGRKTLQPKLSDQIDKEILSHLSLQRPDSSILRNSEPVTARTTIC